MTGLVQGLLGAALNTAGVPSFGGGTSQVRCLALRVDFTSGAGHVRVLAADTSKLAIDGEGELDLHAQTADLHLRPRVRLGPTEVAAPIWLHGSFGDMKPALDPVLGGGRVGMSIGSAPAGPSPCAARLALARGGLGGPLPAAAPAADEGLVFAQAEGLAEGVVSLTGEARSKNFCPCCHDFKWTEVFWSFFSRKGLLAS